MTAATHALVLDEVSWRRSDPQVTLAIAGSSTTGLILDRDETLWLHGLAGFRRPARGRILLGGHDATRVTARKRGIGLVPAPDGLVENWSVARNIEAVIGAPRAHDRRRAADQALDLADLQDARTRLVGQLSPAERARAALARALVRQPRVMVIQAPGIPCERWADTLRRATSLLGIATVVLSDASRTVLPVADRIAVIAGGGIVQEGPSERVARHPATGRVAASFGETNLLPGTVEWVGDDEARLRLPGGFILSGEAGSGLRPGDDALFHLSPDRVALLPGAAEDLAADAIPATLIERRCLGTTTRLRLLIGTGNTILVDRPTDAPLGHADPGARFVLAWPPHAARILPP